MLNREAVSKAFAAAQQDRSQAIALSVARREQVQTQCPRIGEITKELSALGASIAKVFYAADTERTLQALADQSLRLQQEREALLVSLGYSADYLEPPYTCPKCLDKGRVDGKICSCIRERAIAFSLAALAEVSPSERCSFENFDLSFYENITDENGKSALDKAKSNFAYLKAYSEDFSEHSKNLYLFGKTGLGKTHLTLAAAKRIIEKGFDVLYGMAGSIFSDVEKEKFKNIEGKYTMDKLLHADLLIIDDLGSEFQTSFSTSVAHNVIEGRLLAGKPVIITTNLDLNGIHRRYGERIASRILGEYVPVKFEGEDIRQRKKFMY